MSRKPGWEPAAYRVEVSMSPLCYRRHRFPPEIIQHTIWLHLRFTPSYRDVEELLAERGLDISYETVRQWVLKFGPIITRRLRQRRPRPSDRWDLDEMVVRIAGERMYRWRAVDGEVLDMLVQRRRDTRSALRLMHKLLKKQGFMPKLLVTDKLRSYALGVPALTTELSARTAASEQQSGGELASAYTATRAQDAAVQIGSICSALPQHACRGS